MTRKEIVRALEELATLLEVADENPFKARAYQTAARALEAESAEPEALVRTGRLNSIKGVGPATAAEIGSLVSTGSSPTLEKLRTAFPPGLRELLTLPGVGAKKLRAIHGTLQISNLAELEYACYENRLVELPGFGPKSQEKILEAIARRRSTAGRYLLPHALEAERRVRDDLGAIEGIDSIHQAGAVRRACEVIDTGCLILSCREPRTVARRLADGPEFQSELSPDPSAAVVIKSHVGLSFRLVPVPPENLGSTLLWETGSESHLQSLCARAAARGQRLTASGLSSSTGAILASAEDEIYRALDLPWIAPVYREGWGEIAAAEAGTLPAPLDPDMLRGLLHVHTTWSDGARSLEEMVRAARDLGMEYVGISDHSRSAVYAHGMSEERLTAQIAEVERVQALLPEIRILHGAEVDILADGELDYGPEILSRLDFVIASVHGRFQMDRESMTVRIERALQNPYTTFWGHPTGRLLLGRSGYQLDLDHLLDVAERNGVAVEWNANPRRCDLDWRVLLERRARGVATSIHPDAHSIGGLGDARMMIATASKGALSAERVMNTWPRARFESWLEERRANQVAT